MAGYYTRYGFKGELDAENMETVFGDLIEELKTEQFDVPDDEHTQVSIGSPHWSVTAQVSGLIIFDNLDFYAGIASELPENMYLRDIDDAQLKSIWRAVADEDVETLKTFQWVSREKLTPFQMDFYRKAK